MSFSDVLSTSKFSDFYFQTGRKGSLVDESMRIANGILFRSSSSPYPKPMGKAKDEGKAKEAKKGVSYLCVMYMYIG